MEISTLAEPFGVCEKLGEILSLFAWGNDEYVTVKAVDNALL